MHRRIDLVEAGILVGGGSLDVADELMDRADVVVDDGKRIAGFLDQRHAASDLGRTVGDQALDLARSAGATLGQLPHLLRDDGKATTRLARPRRLDAGVERQEVRLEGDLVDDADDRADLLG
ncbi:hypothetical protein D3C87_1744680 [compost metagenome]